MVRLRVRLIGTTILILATLWARPCRGAALHFTEIHHTGDDTLPNYVEVHYSGLTEFELVVFNATVGNARNIRNTIPITASSSDNTIVIHAGTWPSTSPYNGQRAAVPALNLGGPEKGVRLVLFAGSSGFLFNGILGNNETWSDSAHATEMVTLRYDPSLVDPIPSEFGSVDQSFAFDIATNESIFRHIRLGNFLPTFSVGVSDATLRLPDGAWLNPTFVNVAFGGDGGSGDDGEHMPTPAGTGAVALGLFILAAARSGSADRCRRRRVRVDR